jgi:hypothetical protein
MAATAAGAGKDDARQAARRRSDGHQLDGHAAAGFRGFRAAHADHRGLYDVEDGERGDGRALSVVAEEHEELLGHGGRRKETGNSSQNITMSGLSPSE